jgi:VWFA-related protein
MPRRSASFRSPLALSAGFALLALVLSPLPAPLRAQEPDPPQLWPEEERLFWFDGPAWLLSEEEREALLGMAPAERSAWIERFLSAEEIPGVAEEELDAAIRRRRALMRELLLSPNDVRARLLFLLGTPGERLIVDCGEAFVPIEIWGYPKGTLAQNPEPVPADVKDADFEELVLYRPGPGQTWKLWVPYDGKRVLYTDQMEYFLEQWEESNNVLFQARRFDLQACPLTRRVDRASGIRGLTGYQMERFSTEDFQRFLVPPDDLAAWVERAARTPHSGAPELETGTVQVLFPERQGQRVLARVQIFVPRAWELPTAPVVRAGVEEGEEIRLVVEGVVEEGARVLDDFRVRFALPVPEPGRPAVLVFEEPLRPEQVYTLRMRVRDEVGGQSAYLSEAFRVPAEPERIEPPPLPPEAITALAERLGHQRIEGEDDLLLVPPAIDVVLSYWRAEAIVSGERIEEVVFSVDGEEQLTDRRPPFSAELKLARFPTEQVISAVGRNAAGEVVDSDEVVINQARGALAVRITEPATGVIPKGDEVEVRAQVVVPDGRRVAEVRFEIDGEVVATASEPPWRAVLRAPHSGTLSYLSVTAELDDGRTAEDVRFLDAPDFVEQIDVDLLEIYAAVTGKGGRPVKGLTQEDFQVRVDGQPVEIRRFEEVDDLPLTVGIVVDSSGSMAASLAEAMEAARGFLAEVIDIQDHSFSVGFADAPVLLMPPTQDIDAVADSLGRLRAVGWTALHDAVVTGLYYFRGFPGQRAMVLLSDGDDTKSTYAFRDVLEYARLSGVSIYTVGLDVGGVGGAAGKLRELAAETGGRSFFISDADELRAVYAEIEEELRSRYMLAVAPPPRQGDGEGFREVKVEVGQRGLGVRTARGLYW